MCRLQNAGEVRDGLHHLQCNMYLRPDFHLHLKDMKPKVCLYTIKKEELTKVLLRQWYMTTPRASFTPSIYERPPCVCGEPSSIGYLEPGPEYLRVCGDCIDYITEPSEGSAGV